MNCMPISFIFSYFPHYFLNLYFNKRNLKFYYIKVLCTYNKKKHQKGFIMITNYFLNIFQFFVKEKSNQIKGKSTLFLNSSQLEISVVFLPLKKFENLFF